MSEQHTITIRQPRGRPVRLEIELDSEALRLMREGAHWRGESPAAFFLRAMANAIAHEHAAVAAEQAWSERPYDEL
jgi:hypothetical protein